MVNNKVSGRGNNEIIERKKNRFELQKDDFSQKKENNYYINDSNRNNNLNNVSNSSSTSTSTSTSLSQSILHDRNNYYDNDYQQEQQPHSQQGFDKKRGREMIPDFGSGSSSGNWGSNKDRNVRDRSTDRGAMENRYQYQNSSQSHGR